MNVTPFTSNVIKIQLLGSLYKYLGIRVVRVNSSIDWENEYFGNVVGGTVGQTSADHAAWTKANYSHGGTPWGSVEQPWGTPWGIP